MLFRSLRHLLPSGRAWRVTVDKNLRRLFEGLGASADAARLFVDKVWGDLLPQSTRNLPGWEDQFALQDTGLTEQERRDRLAATWRAQGGQDPFYIQNTLQANGFDVYVHEWWQPGTEAPIGVSAAATPRNPLMWLRREFTGIVLLVECGEPLAQCGEEFAQAGNSINPRGYPLVNKVTRTERDIIPLCGEPLAQCGEPSALAGNYFQFRETVINYTVPQGSQYWPYFLYIGAETFGELASVESSRRDEFERLCLKICPAQQWLGILVEYS